MASWVVRRWHRFQDWGGLRGARLVCRTIGHSWQGWEPDVRVEGDSGLSVPEERNVCDRCGTLELREASGES